MLIHKSELYFYAAKMEAESKKGISVGLHCNNTWPNLSSQESVMGEKDPQGR